MPGDDPPVALENAALRSRRLRSATCAPEINADSQSSHRLTPFEQS
jgi:hypothetical protein